MTTPGPDNLPAQAPRVRPGLHSVTPSSAECIPAGRFPRPAGAPLYIRLIRDWLAETADQCSTGYGVIPEPVRGAIEQLVERIDP